MASVQMHTAIAAVIALSVPGITSAAENWHSSTIRMIYPQADGSFILRFHADDTSCTDVNIPKYYYVTVGQNGMTAEGARKLYAAAMLAMSMEKQFTIAFESNGCAINRGAITD
jgi:hypothetical protein